MLASFAVHDLTGRGIDNAIWLAIGVIGLLYYPRRIRRDIKAGHLAEGHGKTKLQRVKMCCYFAIAIGVFRILGVLL